MKFLSLLLLMNFFYAGTPAFMKMASAELSPFEVVFLRHSLAFFAFLPFFLLQKKWRVAGRDFLQILIGSFLSFTFASLLQVWGMRYTDATDGSFIMAMEPLVMILLAVLILKEQLSPKIYGGLCLAILGFLCLSNIPSENSGIAPDRTFGNILFLLAVCGEASFPIFLKPLLNRYPPIVVAFYALLSASLYSLPLQQADLFLKLTQAEPSTLLAVAYLGLGCSFLAAFIWLTCLSQMTASMVAVSWFIQPLFGCLFAFLLMGESIDKNIFIGGSLIFAALFLLAQRHGEEILEKKTMTIDPLLELTLTHVRIHRPLWRFKKPHTLPHSPLPFRMPTSLFFPQTRRQHRLQHLFH